MMLRTSDAVQAGLILGCGAGMAGAGYTLQQNNGGLTHLGVEGLLGMGLATLGLGIVAVWFLALGLALTTELLARRGRFRAAGVLAHFTPALMRRLAVAFLGLNLLTAPAVAHAGPSASASAGTPAVVEVLSGSGGDHAGSVSLPYLPPIRATEVDTAKEQEPPISPAWRPAPLPVDGGLLLRQETRTDRHAEELVVAPGDSLWSIVAGQLGPLATAADIAEAWPVWFEANRKIIGADPSRLIPGQVLVAPPR